MKTAVDKWQATALVALCVVGLVVLALASEVDGELVVGAIAGIPALVLGAGAVAHGVRQGSAAAVEQVQAGATTVPATLLEGQAGGEGPAGIGAV